LNKIISTAYLQLKKNDNYGRVKIMSQETIPVSRGVAIIMIVSTLLLSFVSLTAYTKYIFAKDFNFIVEVFCNQEEEVCFVRDCDEYCPPNGLETYSVFEIPAHLYSSCTSNSCENICLAEDSSYLCTRIICDNENGDVCSS